MEYAFAIVALPISIGNSAIVQESYDEIIEGGGLDNLSSIETHIATILENKSVSVKCMGNSTVSDAAQINAILNRSDARQCEVTVIPDRRYN